MRKTLVNPNRQVISVSYLGCRSTMALFDMACREVTQWPRIYNYRCSGGQALRLASLLSCPLPIDTYMPLFVLCNGLNDGFLMDL